VGPLNKKTRSDHRRVRRKRSGRVKKKNYTKKIDSHPSSAFEPEKHEQKPDLNEASARLSAPKPKEHKKVPRKTNTHKRGNLPTPRASILEENSASSIREDKKRTWGRARSRETSSRRCENRTGGKRGPLRSERSNEELAADMGRTLEQES